MDNEIANSGPLSITEDTTLSLPQIRERLRPVFEKYGIRKAILFGSYAKQCAKDTSDVDLVIDSGLKGLSFVNMAIEVEAALGKPVDIFDITHIKAGSAIDLEIRRTGVVIHAIS